MSGESSQVASSSGSRARGRGKTRGGLGKYLRSRGRGHRGGGRPAEFKQRLHLDGEGPPEDSEENDEEERERNEELRRKYARRHLGTNADRYEEPEAELDSDGEHIVDPEVDLSAFLEKQKLSDTLPSYIDPSLSKTVADDEEGEVDASLAHISSSVSHSTTRNRKGNVKTVEWNEELEEMSREKASADAARDLKSRFRAKSERLKQKPEPTTKSKKDDRTEAPALPLPEGSEPPPPKGKKEEEEDFLDDLLGC